MRRISLECSHVGGGMFRDNIMSLHSSIIPSQSTTKRNRYTITFYRCDLSVVFSKHNQFETSISERNISIEKVHLDDLFVC